MQFFGFGDQLVPEIGVCHADQCFCLFPAGQSLQVHTAVLGAQVVHVCAGVGDDAAVFQGGTDAALQLAGLFIHKGRGQADEALAAVGKVCAQNKVQLTTCTGNVLDACALRVHLTEQVNVHRIVDGDEVVDGGDAADVVGVLHGSGHALRVVVQVIIHLLGAGTKGIDLTALVQILVAAGDLACLCNIHKGIHIHLGVHAQILQVALRDQVADGVGHTADAQLQAGTVGDLRDDEVCHLQIDLGGGTGSGHLADGRVAALHNTGNLGDVHPVLGAAQAFGHVPIDLNDDLFGLIADGTQVGSTGAKVKIAVLVHGGHLEHRHIHGVRAVAIVAGQFRVADGGVEGEALGNGLALNAAHVPAVPGHVGSGILDLEDGGHPHQDAAAEVDILQLGQTLCNGSVHCNGGVHSPAVIHPVAAFDQRGSLVSCHFLLRIQFRKIHYKPSSLTIT